ncbi:EAL domain-containing protein [Aestuariirhabdus sp. Z084]|uniref:EAL domain-containing protein n=1 Tax=Aestuariirhabdus haliotis TaxID=2918751 RepID=UPI00201B355B|nr:EAL domain-containing protein [Aestuariirhabdus haliotis]MCL6417692.1 EAL domain-containing protein [Aestuariirhabdus haliotis]MCL6421631.1 EAL domain-containing protein [Aestuariirhabdus haliotis]
MASPDKELTFADRRQATFVALLAACLFCLAGFVVYVLNAFDEEVEDIEDFLAQVETVIFDGYLNLDKLDRLDLENCSSVHLLAMREILFGQSYIRDIIARKSGQPMCSVIFGPVQSSAGQPESYFTSSRGLIVRKEQGQSNYGPNFSGYSIGNERYDLVYSNDFARAFVPEGRQYQMVFLSSEGVKPVTGETALYTGEITSVLDWRWASGLQVELCSDSFPVCLATMRHMDSWLADAASNLGLIFFAGCFVAWIGYRQRCKVLLRRRSLKSRILRGLSEQCFYPQFQPIVTMESKQVIGCEVLARFEDEYGPIYPDQFIPLIQELDQTWPFSAYMLDRALNELSLQAALPDAFRVSFNLYPSDVSSGAIAGVASIQSARNSRFALTFEIIEDQFLDEELARQHLAALHERGYTIAIDDFGKGYSNLQQIQKIHCQLLKIDRSFVVELEEGAIRASLIPNIIEIARKADLRLVAEGIENNEQYEVLRDWGVEFGQGWLFGKPMAAEALAELCR